MESERTRQEELNRGLKERHIQFIALGGAIGVGLFLGSATAIQRTGPSLILAYAVAGVVLFLMMRALGEMILNQPVSGSFATYAEEFVGPWAGFVTGWTYWFTWVVIGMAEITAVGVDGLARVGVSGDGAGAPGLQRGHPRRPVRRSRVVRPRRDRYLFAGSHARHRSEVS